jgi:predicted transcriptional regulator
MLDRREVGESLHSMAVEVGMSHETVRRIVRNDAAHAT